MKKHTYFILIILIAISCNNGTNEKELVDYPSEYFPLQVGNTWYYDSLSADISPWKIRTISETLIIDDVVYYIYRAGEDIGFTLTLAAKGDFCLKCRRRVTSLFTHFCFSFFV